MNYFILVKIHLYFYFIFYYIFWKKNIFCMALYCSQTKEVVLRNNRTTRVQQNGLPHGSMRSVLLGCSCLPLHLLSLSPFIIQFWAALGHRYGLVSQACLPSWFSSGLLLVATCREGCLGAMPAISGLIWPQFIKLAQVQWYPWDGYCMALCCSPTISVVWREKKRDKGST